MPQTCSVCRSKRLADIDGELIRNRPLRSIARQYRVSPASLFRHKQHLPDKLALAKQHQDTLSAESLLAEMRELKSRLRSGLDEAGKSGNAAGFVAFARELRQTLESYFDISERVAEKARANGQVDIRVVYGDDGHKTAGRNVCEACGQIIDWQRHKRRMFQAVREALGCSPEGGDGEPGGSDSGPPARVEPDPLS
jgi:hypothetical protein